MKWHENAPNTGMNFIKSDNSPQLEELTWGYRASNPDDPSSKSEWTGGITGYGFFWIVCGATCTVVLIVYVVMGLIRLPRAIAKLCTCCDKPRQVAKKTTDERGKEKGIELVHRSSA